MSDPLDLSPEPQKGPNLKRLLATGGLIVLAFFGLFGGWAAWAPLDSAAVAPGLIAVDSNRKVIQHLEGGLVREIMVRDGDLVEAGQALVTLDQTQVESSYNLLHERYLAASARAARLRAERDGLSDLTFPDWLTQEAQASTELRDAIASQRAIFDERRKSIAGQSDILEQRIAQFREEIKGLQGQIKAERRQGDLVGEELADMQALFEKQLVAKSQVMALERQASEIEGRRSLSLARIARAKQSIGESELRIRELETQMRNEAVAELSDVQEELFDLEERRRAAQDIAERTEVRAPIKGIVVGLKIHTMGAVIQPGETLMEIVPTEDALVVTAKVSPNDIDVVRPGLTAQVRLTAYSNRYYVPVEGRVTSVSADHLRDENDGQPYFAARVSLDPESLKEALEGSPLFPGMLAEVMIVTGERTLLDYLLQPLLQSARSAFVES